MKLLLILECHLLAQSPSSVCPESVTQNWLLCNPTAGWHYSCTLHKFGTSSYLVHGLPVRCHPQCLQMALMSTVYLCKKKKADCNFFSWIFQSEWNLVHFLDLFGEDGEVDLVCAASLLLLHPGSCYLIPNPVSCIEGIPLIFMSKSRK